MCPSISDNINILIICRLGRLSMHSPSHTIINTGQVLCDVKERSNRDELIIFLHGQDYFFNEYLLLEKDSVIHRGWSTVKSASCLPEIHLGPQPTQDLH